MGIYIFNTDVLIDLLENSTYADFGAQIIPSALSTHRVFGFDFDGYWEDIGTIPLVLRYQPEPGAPGFTL